jgi:hypothetical protein
MVIYLNDFVIVKTFGKKPYSVSKKFYINKKYPTYEFKTYQQAINFIQESS